MLARVALAVAMVGCGGGGVQPAEPDPSPALPAQSDDQPWSARIQLECPRGTELLVMDRFHRLQRATERPKLRPPSDGVYASSCVVVTSSLDPPLAAWCARVDGARHGPYLVWGHDGKLEARTEYADDRQVGGWVRYRPVSPPRSPCLIP